MADDEDTPIMFYDWNSKDVLTPPTVSVIPGSDNDSFNMSSFVNIRLPFIGQPCGCYELNCGCCAGMMVQQFNFDQKSLLTLLIIFFLI